MRGPLCGLMVLALAFPALARTRHNGADQTTTAPFATTAMLSSDPRGHLFGTISATNNPSSSLTTGCSGCSNYLMANNSRVIAATSAGASGVAVSPVVQAANAAGSGPAIDPIKFSGGAPAAYSLPIGDVVHYISPTGKDSNTGLTPTAAWSTPNHAMHCGDVIVAVAGTYDANVHDAFGNGGGSFGAVTNCPSTSGGIDGAGGIYFAIVLCAGPSMSSCTVNGRGGEAFRVDASNWAVEGFYMTQNNTSGAGCATLTSENSIVKNYGAFINNMAVNCGTQGFGAVLGGSGFDHDAIVGAIAYNTAPSQNGGGFCGSGVSMIPFNGFADAGTHVFVAGSFLYKNINAPSGAGCNTDGEGIILDSLSQGGPYKYQVAIEQNVMWANGSSGLLALPGGGATQDLARYVVLNNTSYGNFQDPKNGGGGEFRVNQYSPSGSGSYIVTNNIFIATTQNTGSGRVWAAAADCVIITKGCTNTGIIQIGNNDFWNGAAPTTSVAGNHNTEVTWNGNTHPSNWPYGTNTYNDGGLASPGSLPSTAPDCAAYTNVADCMNDPAGYSVAGSVLPGGSIGYHAPAGACATDAYFPTWLKGVVYLSWNSGDHTVTYNPNVLINQPCGL